jgi:hypothetical protein
MRTRSFTLDAATLLLLAAIVLIMLVLIGHVRAEPLPYPGYSRGSYGYPGYSYGGYSYGYPGYSGYYRPGYRAARRVAIHRARWH